MTDKDEKRKEQELIDGIFRTTPGIILVLDAEGKIVSLNPYLEELSGYELAEVKGENWFEVFLPDRERIRIGQVFIDTIKDLDTSGTINTITTRDGREIPIEWHNRTLKDESDSIIGVVSIGQDISERVRADELKRIQRDLALAIGSTSSLDDVLNRLLEAVLQIEGIDSGGVYLADIHTGDLDMVTHRGLSQEFVDEVAHYGKDSPQGQIVHAGKSVYREYPSVPAERMDVLRAEGLHAALVIPIMFEGEVVATLNLASHTKETIPPDAREALETIAAQVGGAVAHVRAEEALRASEAEKRLILNSVSELVNYKDTDLRIIWINQAGAALFNLKPEDMVGRQCYEFWGDGTRPCPGCSAEKVIETGELQDSEMVTPDGRMWQIRSYPVKDANKEVVGIVEISQDITERKHAEENLVRLQKLESLSVLAGGIAHDFNNLLMGILGYAEIAKMELGRESPALQSVEQIERSALHAADLTKQMLAYSGKGQFVVEPIDLSKLIDEMDHLLMAAISKKSLLKFNLEKNLPAIEADATQVRQILMNLVTNASDAIGDKSGIINVTTGVMDCDKDYLSSTYLKEELEEGLYVFLEVADTGIGMDDQTAAKIFDPFFTTKFAGRGLGLAAVLGIIRGHGGAIEVNTESGKGTSMRVLFPCSEKDAVELKKEETQKQVMREGVTILVVDDEESVRAVSKLLLEKAGANVITACDGREGLEVLKEHAGDIDVVLLDMTMPHMSGREAFAEMRKIKPNIRIVLASGYTEQDVTDKFEGKGLAGFIQKPYHPGELVKKMVEVLGD